MPEPPAERRPGDRRKPFGDRRPDGRRRSDRSATPAPPVDALDTESLFDPGWLSPGDVAADTPLDEPPAISTPAGTAPEPTGGQALNRVLRTYIAARAAIGLGLVAAQGLASVIGARASEGLALVSIAYAVQAIVLWLLPRYDDLTHDATRQRPLRRRWVWTIGVDLAAFSLLYIMEAGASFNYAALLVLPVLMAGVLAPRLLALGTAAGVALLLLAVAWQLAASEARMLLQSGLAGLGLFVITLLASELAARLTREERAAQGNRALARQQAELNRLVIQEMADGLLVVDGRLRVRAANPAARALLVPEGLSPPAPFALVERPDWHALADAVALALHEGEWPEAGRDVELDFGREHVRTVRLRVRFLHTPMRSQQTGSGPGGPYAVLLLEDLRTLQARIRQEKLAAMGRISAGIAHEIRNPLAAISQANALLMEDDLPATQQRLTRMVADNVQRLKRLVDDVMEVAPGDSPAPQVLDATEWVAQVAADWARTAQVSSGPEGRLLAVLPDQPLGVRFDPEHLRRVLVNLLDNAHRHAGSAPGAIRLQLTPRDELSALLSVESDGPPIPPEVERHLFEPFFSTRSRGSGLGLYICRELCDRSDASIEFHPQPAAERHRNRFEVRMRRVPLVDAHPLLPLHAT